MKRAALEAKLQRVVGPHDRSCGGRQGGQVAEGGEELGFHRAAGGSLQYGVEHNDRAHSTTSKDTKEE